MTTLTLLKSRIADDLNRSDITSQIANAITDSIEHYKNTRFSFSETRDSTFVTVAGQGRYSVSDDADIPLWFDLDAVYVNDGTREYEIPRDDHRRLETSLSDASPSTGVPSCYAYFDRGFWLYPVPDAVYTIRPVGAIEKAAPATDGEANNVWMMEAFELIRCHAKADLAVHVLDDAGLLIRMRGALPDQEPPGGAEGVAYRKLKRKASNRIATGRIVPTSW